MKWVLELNFWSKPTDFVLSLIMWLVAQLSKSKSGIILPLSALRFLCSKIVKTKLWSPTQCPCFFYRPMTPFGVDFETVDVLVKLPRWSTSYCFELGQLRLNWQGCGWASCTSLDTWRCSISFATWLMKPCTNASPTLQQRYYNYRLTRARMVMEGAFGQLKERWRVLLRRCECSQENTKTAALACVVLHNICLEKEDTMTKKMDLAIDPKTGNWCDRTTIRELLQTRACDKIPDTDTRARLIREVLIEKLWLEKQGGGDSWVADFSCQKQTLNVIIWITTCKSEHVYLLFS